MGEFELYLRVGLQHILDINGIDHILFIIALAVSYTLSEWKKVVLLATAFTIGHSLTLALSVYNILVLPSGLIEQLIPVTIILTAIQNLIFIGKYKTQYSYILALCFGFIHGAGFSNYLRELLGNSASIFLPLLGFNIGIEIGQIIVLLPTLLLGFSLFRMFHVEHSKYITAVSVVVLIMAIYLLLNIG